MTKTHRLKGNGRLSSLKTRSAAERSGSAAATPTPAPAAAAPPDAEQRQTMAALEIEWADGAYWFRGDRHADLASALAYARQLADQAPSEIAPVRVPRA